MKPSRLSLSVFLCAIVVTFFAAVDADAQVRFVDKSATGANNGTSWQNAFTTIQPAIDAMFAAGGGQVWVAGAPGGVVYNEARTELWGGPTAYAGSLVMKDNVAVYGGFEGWRGGTGQQETLLNQRAPGINVTVINGATSRAGSPAYHVVVFGKGAAPTVGSRLDGFQITGGNAAGVSGVYHAYRGGGIYNWRSNPVIANCRIYGNTASVSGGGVANEGISGDAAAAQYINCVIDGNTATRNLDWQSNPARGGGGLFINLSTPQVIHCTITANTVGLGAAVPGNPNHGLTSGGIFNVTVGTLPATAGSVLSAISYGNTGNVGIVNAAITGAVKNLTCTYSDIDGGLYPGTGNINALPNFSGAAPFPYQITGAPCLNTGSSAITEDIRLVPRPLGGARDMGAYEYSANGPSAVCAAYTVNLDASCAGTMTAANIDGGSIAEAGIYKRIASQTTFGSADIPSKTVTLTITDRIGRTATCNATVTVNDPIAPVITSCPGNQTLNANAVCVAPAPNLAALVTATDNCGIASITQVPAAGTNLPLGPTPIQITVTDVGGNAVLTCAPVVTVVDVTPPVISVCPPSQSVAGDANCQAVMPNFIPTGTYVDNCGIASVTQNPTAGTTVTGPSVTVTIIVTDTAGLAATCQTALNITDNTNPVAICKNITVNLSAPTVNASAIDGGSTDNCGITSYLIDGAATRTFTCGDMPSTIAVLTVQDAAGNSATCNATVTVVDDVLPVIAMNGVSPVTVECGATYTDAGATANDNCDGPLTPNAAIAVDTAVPGNYTVTYTVSDAAGNAAIPVVRQVNVVDTTAPVISLVGDTEVTVECSTSYTDAGATADDVCDGELTGSISTVNPVDVDVVGDYTVSYDVSDTALNAATQVTRTVHVVDTTLPVITLLGDPVVYADMFSVYTDAGATAADSCGAVDLTGSIVTVNPVDTNTPDTYTVTYDVADAQGNDAVQVTRTVIVLDTSQPDIVLVEVESELTVVVTYNKDMTGGIGMDVPGNYTVSGSGIGTLSANPSSVETVSGTEYRLVWVRPDEMFNGGDIVITATLFSIEDSAGNFIRDNEGSDLGGAIGEAPVITMNGSDETLECNTDTFIEAGATAEDNVDGSVPVIITGDDLVNTAVPDAYIVSYDAEDAAGNAATVTRTVTVADTAAPVIELLGEAVLQLECNVDIYEEAGATAADVCEGDLTSAIVIGEGANTAVLGLQIVTYSVSDGAGNTANAEREVTVADTTAPSIALLGDNPVILTDGSLYVEAGAEAWDECEGDLSGAIVIDGDVANTNEVATYVLTYTVSDSSANSVATARTVVVKPEDCELAYELTVDVNPVTPGGTSTFTAAPLPENCSAGELHYIWTKNGEVIPDAPDAAIYVIESAEFTDTGAYKCSVSDASSSVDTNEVALIVTSGVPVAGAFGLLLAAAASAIAGVASLRKRR